MIRIILDSQILTTYQLCEEMLNLRFNQNLIPITGMGSALEKGLMMHGMLQAFYGSQQLGISKADAFMNAIKAGELYITGCEQCVKKICTVHARNEVIGMQNTTLDEAHFVIETFHRYCEFWRNDSWTTVDTEIVKRAVIYEDENISVMWSAKVDWYVDNLEGLFSVDHKTASRQEEPLSLDNQFIGQCVVTKQNKMFRNVIGFQKSLKNEEKFKREAVNYSKERIAEWILECASYAYDIAELQQEKRFRHKFTSCRRRYGDCIYRRICEAEPSDRERIMMKDFKQQEVWDISND